METSTNKHFENAVRKWVMSQTLLIAITAYFL